MTPKLVGNTHYFLTDMFLRSANQRAGSIEPIPARKGWYFFNPNSFEFKSSSTGPSGIAFIIVSGW